MHKIAYPIFTSVDRKVQIHCSHSWSQTKLRVSGLFLSQLELDLFIFKNYQDKNQIRLKTLHVNASIGKIESDLVHLERNINPKGWFMPIIVPKGVPVHTHPVSDSLHCVLQQLIFFLASRKPTESEAKLSF